MNDLQPGVNIKPTATINDVEVIVEEYYGYKCKKIVVLPGYDDCNYKIKTEDDGVFVLKIMNSLEQIEFIEGTNSLLLFLREYRLFNFFIATRIFFFGISPDRKGFSVPKPTETIDGALYKIKQLQSGEHVIRLMQYIPGVTLLKAPTTPKLFYQIGQLAANLDAAMTVKSQRK